MGCLISALGGVFSFDCSRREVTGIVRLDQMRRRDVTDKFSSQVANLNDRSSFPNESFDFVHSRFVAVGIGRFRWPSYLTDIYRYALFSPWWTITQIFDRILRHGGWLQVTEWDLQFRSNNGRSDSLQALREWTRLYHASLDATGVPEGKKSTTVAQDCEAWLRTARFQGVRTDVRDVPTCAWHQGM